MRNARKDGFHTYFQLVKTMTYSNTMVLFNALGKLTVYNSTSEILRDHFAERNVKYKQRHAFLLSKMEARVKLITNRARFIIENIEKKMTVMNRKKKDVIKTLIERKYDSDPVKAWKIKIARETGIEVDDEKDDEPSEEDPKADFDYLLKMPIYNLTLEQKEKLLAEKGTIEAAYAELEGKTPIQLWKEDLDSLENKLDELDKMQKDAEKADAKKTSKKGGKNLSLEPSADGEYIDAVVTKEMAKKINDQASKGKGVKKEKKPKAEPKPKKEPKATVKQETKNDSDDSIGKIKKKNGKNPWDTDSDDNDDGDFDSGSDDIDAAPKREPTKKRARGISSDAAADEKPKPKKPMKQGKTNYYFYFSLLMLFKL